MPEWSIVESYPNRESDQQAEERVIVLLDDSLDSMQSLKMAAGLARRRQGLLLGVFVEELDPGRARNCSNAFACQCT